MSMYGDPAEDESTAGADLMATITQTTDLTTLADQRVVLHDVGWRGYLTLLRLRGERSRPRIVYLDGDASLMSPAFAHELLKRRLGLFVTEVAVGLGIPCLGTGQTTFRRKKKGGGVEADESFYLTHVDAILAKKKATTIDLREDPPPDLVVEAVNTHEADASVEVWRRFGVPEVWVCDERSLTILVLQEGGAYAEAGRSRAFPVLAANEIHEWVARAEIGADTDWVPALRSWVASTLVQRRQHGDPTKGDP